MYPVDSKILILDDSSFARHSIKKALSELKYWKIFEAKDTPTAKSEIVLPEHIQDPFLLVIVDIHMPEVSGLEFLRWVRSQAQYKTLPVIILSSSNDKSDVLEAGKLGASHYMTKPFDVSQLKEKIASTWQKHGQKYSESLRVTTK